MELGNLHHVRIASQAITRSRSRKLTFLILGADFVDLHLAVKVQLDVVLLCILFYSIFFVCGLTHFFNFFGCSGVVGTSSDCLLEVFMHGEEVGK